MPTWVRVVTVVLGCASVYSLLLHIFKMAPLLKSNPSMFKVVRVFGRWAFLTRWCLAFQCVHHVCCAVIAVRSMVISTLTCFHFESFNNRFVLWFDFNLY